MKSFAVSTRRKFLLGTGATALATAVGGLSMPAISRASSRPRSESGTFAQPVKRLSRFHMLCP